MTTSVPSKGEKPAISEELFEAGLAMAEVLPKPREEFVRLAEKDLGATALNIIMKKKYQNSLTKSIEGLMELLQGLGPDELETLSTNLIEINAPEDNEGKSALAYQLESSAAGSHTLTIVAATTDNGMIVSGEKLIFSDSGTGSDRQVKVGLAGLADKVSTDELTPLKEISVPELAALSVFTEGFDKEIETALLNGSVEIEPTKLF